MTRNRGCGLSTHELHVLDEACIPIRAAFDTPYLVGSAGQDPDYRDVDVRLILADEEFDRLFPQDHESVRQDMARWELLCLAIGDYLRRRTGLPIDFQVQRRSEANERHNKQRNPLGMRRIFAGGGDATPWTPKARTDG